MARKQSEKDQFQVPSEETEDRPRESINVVQPQLWLVLSSYFLTDTIEFQRPHEYAAQHPQRKLFDQYLGTGEPFGEPVTVRV